LVEIENQLLGLLIRLARSEGELRAEIQDFSSWLEGKRPELINEAPDSKAWFKSDPSCPRSLTKTDSMHLLGSTSRVFTVEPRDGREEIMGEEDMGNDRIEEDKMNEEILEEDTTDGNKADEAEKNGSDADKMDIDGDLEIEGPGFSNAEGGVAGANAGVVRTIVPAGEVNEEEDVDMHGQDTPARKDVEGTDGMNDKVADVTTPAEGSSSTKVPGSTELAGEGNDDDEDMHAVVTPARRAVEGNDGMIDMAANVTLGAEGGCSTKVHATKDAAGGGNEEDDDDMHGQDTPATKDVEGNDGMKDIAMDGLVGVAGGDDEDHEGAADKDHDEAEPGKEKRDNVSGEDVQENGDDMDALTSIANEDDDDDKPQSSKAVKGKKLRKLERQPVKIPKSDQSKGLILGDAGLRKETAIDVDAFFVSIFSDGFLMGSLTLLS
jgi:hypothetical protein